MVVAYQVLHATVVFVTGVNIQQSLGVWSEEAGSMFMTHALLVLVKAMLGSKLLGLSSRADLIVAQMWKDKSQKTQDVCVLTFYYRYIIMKRSMIICLCSSSTSGSSSKGQLPCPLVFVIGLLVYVTSRARSPSLSAQTCPARHYVPISNKTRRHAKRRRSTQIKLTY